MNITISEKIRLIARRKGVTLTELARRTEQTRQNLNNKLNRNAWTQAELEQVAKALGVSVQIVFTDQDGTTL